MTGCQELTLVRDEKYKMFNFARFSNHRVSLYLFKFQSRIIIVDYAVGKTRVFELFIASKIFHTTYDNEWRY